MIIESQRIRVFCVVYCVLCVNGVLCVCGVWGVGWEVGVCVLVCVRVRGLDKTEAVQLKRIATHAIRTPRS